MIINNTDRDFFIQPKHAHIEKSDFKGIIGQDTIPFDIQMLPTCISSHDTLIGHLAHMFYDPKMIDSLFLDKIKCMNLIYSLPKNTVKGENGMQYLSFEKHDSSKFIILRDNVGIEGAFIFGIYEFKPYLADTTFMSYDKSLVTGEYIYDLCHKMLED
jgi:hypothetical protein